MEEKNSLTLFLTERNINIAATIIGIAIGVYLDWEVMEILIFGIFIWSVLGHIPSRILAIPALIFLSIMPFLLVSGRKDRAEEFAIYAYYFLVITVIMGIYELRRDKLNVSED